MWNKSPTEDLFFKKLDEEVETTPILMRMFQIHVIE